MATENDTSTGSSSSSPRTAFCCHALPCSIDYTGKANNVPIYFQPRPLNENTGASDDPPHAEKTACWAASFRGRGLLAMVPNNNEHDTDKSLCGVLLRYRKPTFGDTNKDDGGGNHHLQMSDTTDAGTLEVVSSFQHFVEWYHEHDPAILSLNSTVARSRSKRAREWMEIASAVHAPVPPMQNSSTAHDL